MKKPNLHAVSFLVPICSLLAAHPASSADLFYMKSLSLHVIHDADEGKSESSPLDTAVSTCMWENFPKTHTRHLG